MTAITVGKHSGKLGDSYSFVSVRDENIVIETVKKAEDGDGIIVRMYESFNKRTNTVLKTGFDFKSVTLCDMLENDLKVISAKENLIPLTLKPFEIVTIKIR